MKKLIALLVVQVLGVGILLGRPPTISDVIFERHCAADFDLPFRSRTNCPSRFRHFLYRTDKTRMDGLYAIVLLRSRHTTWKGATLELGLLRLGSSELYTVSMPLDAAKPRERELWVGLTTESWNCLTPKNVIAWRVRILREGAVLCEKISFLYPLTG